MNVELRRITQCRACRQPIIFAETSAGKVIPINAEPVAHGTVALFDGPGSGKVIALFGKKATSGATELFVAHFATCPAAEQFRKPRKRSGAMRLS